MDHAPADALWDLTWVWPRAWAFRMICPGSRAKAPGPWVQVPGSSRAPGSVPPGPLLPGDTDVCGGSAPEGAVLEVRQEGGVVRGQRGRVHPPERVRLRVQFRAVPVDRPP